MSVAAVTMVRAGAWVVAVWCAITPAAVCRAEQLPIRAYNAADGLPSDDINAITRDSRGFLWFATDEGLARFDGYEFRAYGRAQGLPRDAVSDFLETRSGQYFAATARGLAKFEPDGPPGKKFTVYQGPTENASRIYVLYEDGAGNVWCGTEGGLYRLRNQPGPGGGDWHLQAVQLGSERDASLRADQRVISLFADSRGDLWIGTFHTLYRRTRSGHLYRYRLKPLEGNDFLWNAVLEDAKGRIWAGTGCGLWRLLPDGQGDYKPVRVFVPRRRLVVWKILEDTGERLWLATSAGLLQVSLTGDALAPRIRLLTEANGLTQNTLAALGRDVSGNLWLGTESSGAMRIAKGGFVTYTAADRLSFGKFTGVTATLMRDRSGEVHPAFHHVMDVLNGEAFSEVTPAIPRQHGTYLGWGWHQTILQDKTGEWWIPTAEGLVRFPAVPLKALARTRPKAVYTVHDGLRTNDIFRVYEDRAGGIWVASIGPAGINGLSRWDRDTHCFRQYTEHTGTVATAFAEDRDGTLWVGYYDGTLGRFRGGVFHFYGVEDGLAGDGIQALQTDRAGRLWIASLRGLLRLDRPSGEHPHFTRFGVEDGLSSNMIFCLAEDRWGAVYAATGRGLDWIPAGGRIAPGCVRHYTQADGLARGTLRDILFDRAGDLWCASRQGISRLHPRPGKPQAPPRVFIRQLRVRGAPYRTWDLGTERAGEVTLASHQNQLQIDFAGLTFAPGAQTGYQYKLEPADRAWSEPSSERMVNYGNVASGSYRFSVRLIADGTLISRPATLDFRVLAPVWQRWWFQLLVALSAALILFWLHHYRTLRLLEVERIRTRIAADLHDDIGAGLSQIAVLTEVAHTRVTGAAADLEGMLSTIGSVSRELAESINDIVWSVNPQRDHVSDLLQRMRRFSSDLLGSGNVDFVFRAASVQAAVLLDASVRRDVYLIFKEAVNNVARHASCTHAEIAIWIENGELNVRIEDDGQEGAARRAGGGNGLRNMRLRAERIGARLECGVKDPVGYHVTLRVPLPKTIRGRIMP